MRLLRTCAILPIYLGILSTNIHSFAQTGPITILEHVRVVSGDGPIIESGYVAWQGSMIVAVGSGETPTELAGTHLEGKGQSVYPGFIDVYCFAGISAPPTAPTPTPPTSGGGGGRGGQNRPAAPAPALPLVWKKATEVFKVPDNVFAAMRNSGFTTANLIVRGTLTPGEAALVNLTDKKAADILKERSSINLNTLTRGFNSYPSTLMAAFTFLRQSFYDGIDSRNHPPVKPDLKLECFGMAAGGGLPVMISAGAENDILRAIRLGNEFGFKPAVVNSVLPDGMADKLKVAGIPVIVTGDGDGIPSLEKAKVPFAVSSGSTDMSATDAEELLTRLRDLNAKKNVPKDALIASVTSVPAKILGMSDKIGSIKVGKLANLTIFEGDFFAEKSSVKFVVISGAKIDHAKVASDTGPRPIRTAADGVPYKNTNFDDADGDGE